MRILDVRAVRFDMEGMTGGILGEDEDINVKKEEEVDIKVEIDRSPRSPDTDLLEESQVY
ncbi:hypothetical protein VKT23_008410 [Stygiomarasmius scandens]|uniref:Uncharacterized protein n=1 Tax=Marasmiellus scandens TaxID=2682957 RepID=A0ABR1JME3_9AGAR